MKRRYGVQYHSNSHDLCVNKMACYNFNVTDTYGDGMCWGGSTGCGFYELSTPGEEPFARGGSFTIYQTTSFCIDNEGKKVDELPVLPPKTPGIKRRKAGKKAK